MKVQMKDDLSSSSLHIEYKLVPRLIDALLPSRLLCLLNQMENHRLVLLGEIVHAPDMSPRDNEQMDRRLGSDVPDHREEFILIDKVRLFFSS